MAKQRIKLGGNESPYDTWKWGNNRSPDVKAVVGAWLASGAQGLGDLNYGLPLEGPIPEGPSDKGKYEWETINVGKAPELKRGRPGRSNLRKMGL